MESPACVETCIPTTYTFYWQSVFRFDIAYFSRNTTYKTVPAGEKGWHTPRRIAPLLTSSKYIRHSFFLHCQIISFPLWYVSFFDRLPPLALPFPLSYQSTDVGSGRKLLVSEAPRYLFFFLQSDRTSASNTWLIRFKEWKLVQQHQSRESEIELLLPTH